MKSLNRIELIGYVGADPEIRTTAEGTKVAKLTLATNRKSGKEEVADWHSKAQVVTEQLLQSGTVSRQLYRQLVTYLEACRTQQARLEEGKYLAE